MRLELLNINQYIQKKNIKQVKSARIEGRGGKLDAEGLFSEVIFGRVGTPVRRNTFGYIKLNVRIIHPEVWDFVIGLSPLIGKMVIGRKSFLINEKGLLEETNGEFGLSGIKDLIDNWDKIDLKLLSKNKPDVVKFLIKNKESIFIDNLLVLPAGIRDIQQSKLTNKKLITSSEINHLYEELLQQTKTIDGAILQFLDNETIKNIVGAIQRKCIEINRWIQDRLKGKSGLLRGGLLSKTIDYSGRFNIVGDVTLPVGYIGLPWQAILKLYEPFTLYQILKNPFNVGVKELIREQSGVSQLDSASLKRFIVLINEQPDTISPLLKDELVRIAEDIVKGKVILYKRDPVENRDSYLSGYIRVDRDSFVAKIQTLDTVRTGGDFDGDTFCLFPLFTKTANDEAIKKLNPKETKSMWISPSNNNDVTYIINLDAAAAIYTVTKR